MERERGSENGRDEVHQGSAARRTLTSRSGAVEVGRASRLPGSLLASISPPPHQAEANRGGPSRSKGVGERPYRGLWSQLVQGLDFRSRAAQTSGQRGAHRKDTASSAGSDQRLGVCSARPATIGMKEC